MLATYFVSFRVLPPLIDRRSHKKLSKGILLGRIMLEYNMFLGIAQLQSQIYKSTFPNTFRNSQHINMIYYPCRHTYSSKIRQLVLWTKRPHASTETNKFQQEKWRKIGSLDKIWPYSSRDIVNKYASRVSLVITWLARLNVLFS